MFCKYAFTCHNNLLNLVSCHNSILNSWIVSELTLWIVPPNNVFFISVSVDIYSLSPFFLIITYMATQKRTIFFRHSLHWWVFHLFPIFLYSNNVAMNTHKMIPHANMQVFVKDRSLEMDFLCHGSCILSVLILSPNLPKRATAWDCLVSHILINPWYYQLLKILQIWWGENRITFFSFPV